MKRAAVIRQYRHMETLMTNSSAIFTPPAQPRLGDPVLLEREKLYGSFRPLVQRLIRRYGSDPELRQDLEGEIYCRFCALLAAYDPLRGVPLRPYLVRQLTASVHTYARGHWRRQRREVRLEEDAGVSEPAGYPLGVADPGDQWDHELMMQQVREKLPEAIARLPLRQRQVVIWRYYEFRPFEEIAEMLDVRPATARSLLRHGLNHLRRLITQTDLGYA
jgi:RNA polymerase sigma factor (sigma-70 family)